MDKSRPILRDTVPQITIATRRSPLALKQSELVKAQILNHFPNTEVTLLPLQTKGDSLLQQPLANIGGKGLFTQALEQALLEGQADIAVHSLKDIPQELPEPFCLPTVLSREDPRDVLISQTPLTDLNELKSGAVIGTASQRRACQLKQVRADFTVTMLRGNLQTRLSRLADYDAIILAAAGLKRMSLQSEISHYLPITQFIPAAGQGALCIEMLKTRNDLTEMLSPLHCDKTGICVSLEREIIAALGGGCHSPIGAYAYFDTDEHITLRVFVGNMTHHQAINTSVTLPASDASSITSQMMTKLETMGAKTLLSKDA